VTLRTFPLDGVNGTAATTANTGGNTVAAAGAASVTFDTSSPLFQGSSYLNATTVDTTNTAYVEFPFNSAQGVGAFSIGVRIPATPPAVDTTFISVRDTALVRILSVVYTAAGTIVATDRSNTNLLILTAAQATAGSWFRFEGVINNLSATAATWHVRAYSGTSTTAVGNNVGPTGTGNTGTTTFATLRVGAATLTPTTIRFDSVQTDDGRSTEIGLYVPPANVPPTVSAGADQTASLNTPVTLTSIATDSDGTIASRQWTCIGYPATLGSAPTITNATSATATFTPTTPGAYTFRFTATDNGGATGTDVTSVYVPTASVTFNGAVENSGGWTGTYLDVDELESAPDDTTFLTSSGSGTWTGALAPVTPNTSAYVWVRTDQGATGATETVALLQGFLNPATPATVIGSWPVASIPTNNPTTFRFALTSGQIAAISDWNRLQLRFS
jgi:hypothetical protein